uniref:FYVE-type domain-containing protein n=1 Tax=Onchocerca volvulus TaxID=6282 RepID=A0A8R1U2L6_ONCVO
MAAVINAKPSSLTRCSMGIGKPVLLHKIEGQISRVNGIHLLSTEEGVLTISDDRSLRVYLKRDNEQFWPSIYHYLPFSPSSMHFDEYKLRLFVGLINGSVYEYKVAEDMNSLSEQRHWMAHLSLVTSVLYSPEAELIFSCSKDKTTVWHCSETSLFICDERQSVKVFAVVGSYTGESGFTALEFDVSSKFVFLGDSGGGVILLRLNGSEANVVTTLSAHTSGLYELEFILAICCIYVTVLTKHDLAHHDTITSLAWDSERQLLFSAGADHLVIMWDIGGKKGQAFELNAHNNRLTCLRYAQHKKRLFSADEDGSLVCWDMTAKRVETPGWKTSDSCQLCDSPFFWNFREMWDKKVVGLRQHHCRTCGNAVCAKCCANTTRYPPMGYELPVRICNACQSRMQQFPDQFDLTSLAVISKLHQGIICMHLQESTGRLVTAGSDRILMIWDVKQLV